MRRLNRSSVPLRVFTVIGPTPHMAKCSTSSETRQQWEKSSTAPRKMCSLGCGIRQTANCKVLSKDDSSRPIRQALDGINTPIRQIRIPSAIQRALDQADVMVPL